jgi:hypothetical protein
MPVVPRDRDGHRFGVADRDPQRVAALVKCGLDPQPGARGRRAEQLDDDLVADQRPAAPVGRDRAEQPMLSLVPLLVPGGKWQTVGNPAPVDLPPWLRR